MSTTDSSDANEPTESSNSGSGWWGGFFQAAKEKSLSAVNMVKKDLAEFTSTMHQDTNRIATEVKTRMTQENASSATQKMKDGVSNLFGGISKVLSVEPSGESGSGKKAQKDAVYNRSKARLRAMQVDPNTYTCEPTGEKEVFNQWLSTFDIEKKKEEIAELLVSNVDIRSLYTQLVPMQVKHVEFWHRYFYKVHQLQLDEMRRAQLLMRVDVTQQQTESDNDWDDIDGPSSPVEEPEILTPTSADTVISSTVKSYNVDLPDVAERNTNEPLKSFDNLTLSELHCHTDAISDSEASQSTSSSKATSSFATVTSTSSPSTQSAELEDMACSSSETEEPPTPTVKILEKDTEVLGTTNKSSVVLDSSTAAVSVVDNSSQLRGKEDNDAVTGKESNGEDDWEKEFDVSSAEIEQHNTLPAPSNVNSQNESEDWENWE